MQTSYTAQGGYVDKEFRYVQGDFPPGTRAQRNGNEVWLGLPARWWLFRYTKWLPLKGNVTKVEVIQPPALPPTPSLVNKSLSKGVATLQMVAQATGERILARVANTVSEWGLFDERQVVYSCTLRDGRSFVAQSTMKHYRWLANESMLQQSVTRFQNFEFADATMAACALMAFVDGEVSVQETRQVEAAIAAHEVLRSLSPEELKGRFTFYCDAMRREAQTGYEACIGSIRKLSGKEDQARALVHIMIDIGQANEFFGQNQENCVRNVCGALGIYPGEFGLYYT